VVAQFALTLLACQQSKTPELTYELKKDIAYRIADGDRAIDERCRLDFYYPRGQKNFPTVIWFHGGGLTGGNREIPERLKKQGFAVIGAGYRLAPTVKVQTCIEDAAAAVAWMAKNIESYGGSTKKLFLSGHSAGGFLANMVVLDKKWLLPYGVDPDGFAGLVPFSGQSITHYTMRKERGIGERTPVVDEFAPQFHVRKDAPPILLLSGDREKELYGRYEESAYFWRMFKEVGHPDVRIMELQGYDHGGMVDPGLPLLTSFIKAREKQIDGK
jgi:acetyl esterase/lipase